MRVYLFFLSTLVFLAACSGTKNGQKDPLGGATMMDEVSVYAYDYKKTYNEAETLEWDLLNTRLEVEPDWEEQYLYGKATLVLEPHFYPQTSLKLDAKGFLLNKVALSEYDELNDLDYKYDDMILEISLDDTVFPGEQINIFIDYVARPNELEETYSEAIESDIGLYFIDPLDEDSTKPTQLWTQGETEASSCWFPTIDQPNAKTTSQIYITVDTNYTTLSNGVLVGDTTFGGKRTDLWMMSQPHAPYLFAMAIGEFGVTVDTWRGMDVTYYLEEEYHPYARDIFGNTPEMLDFYSDIFGVDYPWEKYAQVVVRDFVSGAMENTTATIHYDGLNQTPREMLDGDHEDIIAHELVHHWFGDLVTCESWANLPLNESFATYGEYLWIDYKYGRAEADRHLAYDLNAYLSEAENKQVDLIRYDYESPNDMFDRHSYQKGGLVLHYLRNIIGDEAFFEGLRIYLNDRAFNHAEIDHLRLAFEEVTGQDLHWFFNQWFFNSGHPELDFEYEWIMAEEEEGVQQIIVRQKASNSSGYVFRMPIAIDFYMEDAIVRKNIVLDAPADTFTFNLGAQPIAIMPDGDNAILATIEEDQSAEAYFHIYQNAPLAAHRWVAVYSVKDEQAESEAAAKTVLYACDDEFWGNQVTAINYLDEENIADEGHQWTLMRLATLQDKADVREAATEKLDEWDIEGEEMMEALEMLLNDPSYDVNAAALSAMGDIDSDRALEKANEWEKEDNYDIKLAVMETYANHGDSSKQAYFEKVLAAESGFGLYYPMFYYGNYLGRMKKSQAMKGMKTIEAAGETSDAWWATYATTGSLKRILSGFGYQKEKLEAELKELEKFNVGREQEINLELDDIDDVIEAVTTKLDELENEKPEHP